MKIQLRSSWLWAKISLETCRAVKEQYIILHSCILFVIFVNYILMHGTTNVMGLHVTYRHYQILMKLESSVQSIEKYSNIKFHGNPSGGSGVVPCRRAHRHDEDTCRSRQFFRTHFNKNDHYIALGRAMPKPGIFGLRLYRSI